MTEQRFWELIQTVHEQSSGDMERKCEGIKYAVKKLSIEDAISFSNIFDDMMDRAYSWPLWGAAYVMNGGCGDDAFTDFRAALISRGKQSFEDAISNPDSLANESFDEDAWYFEGFQYAITEGLESVVGSTPSRNKAHPVEPSGEPWEEDPEELKVQYPNLWVSFEHMWSVSEQPNSIKSKPWWKFW